MKRKLIDAALLLYSMRFSGGFIKDGQIYVPLREVRQAIAKAPAVDVERPEFPVNGGEKNVQNRRSDS